MENIHIRLSEELKRLNISMADAARAIGEGSSQGIRDVCSGRKRASAELVAKLAGTGTDVLYILTGQRSNEITASAAAYRPPLSAAFGEPTETAKAYQASALNQAPDGFVLVPRYDVTGSMGNGQVIHSEQIVDHLAFRAEWVRTELGTSPKNLALISAVGDSMEPALRAHDLLLIDRSVLNVKQDAIYAFAVDGELRVKRIQRLFDGSLIIKSDNPSYATETLTTQQAESINLVGRVVWSGRRM